MPGSGTELIRDIGGPAGVPGARILRHANEEGPLDPHWDRAGPVISVHP
jgi:hypothetical protein